MPSSSLVLALALCAAGPVTGRPQDQEPARSAMEELLELVRDVTGTSPSVAPGLTGLGGLIAAPPSETPSIRAHRTRDPVEVAQGGGVHVLPYWSPEAVLEPGDELRCGSSGHCLVEYPDGTDLRIRGEAVLRAWTAAEASPRHLELRHLANSVVATLQETPTQWDLPSGYSVVGADARLHLHRQDGEHLVLDNSGPATVFVRGPLLARELVELAPGETILLPVLPILARAPFLATQVARVGDDGTAGCGMLLEVAEGVQWDFTDPWLTLRASGPEQAVARIAGARFMLTPDREWRLRRAPLGQARPEEQ